MNQIVHIFRKDCRRLWQIIAAVLVFTYLHGYGDATNPGGGVAIGLSPYALFYVLVGLSGLFLSIALFLLVVSVIQEESLVGSDKFWLTRPYSRLGLFLEKLMFVVLWAVVPMLVHDVILIRYFGFSLSSAFGLLLWKYAQFGFFLLVAATLAVLSASFARAVLLAIIVILAASLTFSVGRSMESGGQHMAATISTYILLAALALGIAGAACVIAFQYRFRITSVAAAIGVAVILVCALLARFWPSSLTAYLLQKNESPLLRSIQIVPDADLKDIARPPKLPNSSTQPPTTYYPFQAVGLSDNVGVDLIEASAHVDSPGQKSATLYLWAGVRFQPRAYGSGQFAEAGGPDQLVSFAPPNPEDYYHLKNTDGTLSGKLVLEGFHSAVTKVPVPLPGTKHDFAVGGRRCSVGSFLRGPTLGLRVDCVELEPGNTSQFLIRVLQDNREIGQSGGSGQSHSVGGWPAFLSPIVRAYSHSEFELPGVGLVGELPSGLEMIVFAEQGFGYAGAHLPRRTLPPYGFGLHALEQRGVLSAESAGSQSNGGTSPKTQ